VGHDWGAAVGYVLAMSCPQVLERLVALSGTHPDLFHRELGANHSQMAAGRHWLTLRRQDSAERLVVDDFRLLRGTFAHH
jgi:pimeloyl-ACP methyl ester carboxylesterase